LRAFSINEGCSRKAKLLLLMDVDASSVAVPPPARSEPGIYNPQSKIGLPRELGFLLTSAQRSLKRTQLREVPDSLKRARMLEELPVGGDQWAVQFNCQGQEGGVIKREVKLPA